MWSASSLVRDCAFVNVLKKRKPKAANVQFAADRGTAFHKAVEQWIATGVLPELSDMEMQGWIDLLASLWRAGAGAKVEIAWGLGLDGQHVEVAEPEPHVYVAADGVTELLTAGRADIAYDEFGGGTWWLDVGDWKTGIWPAPAAPMNLQTNAAGIALASRFGSRAYRPWVYYTRSGYFDYGDVIEIGSPEHAAMLDEVRASALLPASPIPGPHCRGCWERKACPSAETSSPEPSETDPF